MDFTFIQLAGSAILGLIVGLLTGIFGVGGGFLMTPSLMILLSIPGPLAVGTDLLSNFCNATVALHGRKGSGTVDSKLAVIIASGSIIGVLIGSQLLDYLKDLPRLMVLGKEQDPVQFTLLVMFFLLLLWIACFLYWDYHRNGGKAPKKRIGSLHYIKLPPYMHFSSLEEPKLSVALLVVLGFVVGLLTGLMGIGGGVVLLPALIYLVGQRTVKAAGTSLLLVWISSLVAVGRKMGAGDVSFVLFVPIIAGRLIGTHFGTKIGLRLHGPKIRLYFVFVVLVVVALVAFKLYRLCF